MSDDVIRAFDPSRGDYRWDGVEPLRYKDEGDAPFRDVVRQTLFRHPGMKGELRYFEVAAGGYSTLERHAHVHAVMILRGAGRALVGTRVCEVKAFDLITVSALCWHQFRAEAESALGFLCMVDAERDKPQLPTEDDLARMRASPKLAAFLDGYRRPEYPNDQAG